MLREVVSGTCETPDAIGWRNGWSMLIECKVSRSDFQRDAQKYFRQADGLHGMGSFRWYMTPPGLLRMSEVPEGWGLLEVHTRSVFEIHPAVQRELSPSAYRSELLHQMRGIRMVNGEDDYPVKKSAAYVDLTPPMEPTDSIAEHKAVAP